MGVDPQFALPASCRTACTDLKESFILAMQKIQWQGEVGHQSASDRVWDKGRAFSR